MSEHKHNLDEQLDAVLGASIPEEQPGSAWKVELIETMEQKTSKKGAREAQGAGGIRGGKKKWWIAVPTAIALPVVGFFAFTVVQNITAVTGGGQFAMGPYAIPSDWEYDHVSYEAAQGFELPYPISDYKYVYPEFTRDALDPIAAEIDPEMLNNVEVKEREIIYTAGNHTFAAYLNNKTAIGFEWSAREWPTTKNGTLKHQFDDVDCDATAVEIEGILESVPALVADIDIVIEGAEWGGNECAVLYKVNDDTQVNGFDFVYDGAELVVIRGKVLTDIVHMQTEEYGTLEEILEDLNARPNFPLAGGDHPDLDIVYEVTDYRVRMEGLQLYMQMKNIDAVYEAFGFTNDIQAPPSFAQEYSGSWHTIQPNEDRDELIEKIERYKETGEY